MALAQVRQFGEDVRAVAAVEFALILPLLITLYVGTVEVATLYSADHKVATVANTMADLVARSKNEITSAELTKYFDAARTIMQPYTTTGLGQVVSLLSVDSSGVAKVKWSVKNGTATARTVDSTYPLASTTKINELARGASGWLVVSEITYPHKPIVGFVITGTVDLKHVQYYLPRFGAKIELK